VIAQPADSIQAKAMLMYITPQEKKEAAGLFPRLAPLSIPKTGTF